MDTYTMLLDSLKANNLFGFLRGDPELFVESSQFSPGGDIPNTSKIISNGIYKAYENNPEIKEKFESSLLKMTSMSDYDIYVVASYLFDQLYNEKKQLSPFILNYSEILSSLCKQISLRKTSIQKGVIYPNGYVSMHMWEKFELLNKVFIAEFKLPLGF